MKVIPHSVPYVRTWVWPNQKTQSSCPMHAGTHRDVCNVAAENTDGNSLCLPGDAFDDVIFPSDEQIFLKVPEKIKFYFPSIFVVAASPENWVYLKMAQKLLTASMENRVRLQAQVLPTFWSGGIFESFGGWRTFCCTGLSSVLQNL